MKKIVFACIALVVLGMAWTLWTSYLEHEKERFVESLPKVPAAVNLSVDTGDVPLDAETDVTGATATQAPSLRADTSTATDELPMHIAAPEREHLVTTKAVDDSVVNSPASESSVSTLDEVNEVDEGNEERTFRMLPFPHVCDSHVHPPVDWKNLSHAERAELTIEHLYRRVGDTLAVRTFASSLRNPDRRYSLTEQLKIAEAIYELYPTEANKRAVEETMDYLLNRREPPRIPHHP